MRCRNSNRALRIWREFFAEKERRNFEAHKQNATRFWQFVACLIRIRFSVSYLLCLRALLQPRKRKHCKRSLNKRALLASLKGASKLARLLAANCLRSAAGNQAATKQANSSAAKEAQILRSSAFLCASFRLSVIHLLD